MERFVIFAGVLASSGRRGKTEPQVATPTGDHPRLIYSRSFVSIRGPCCLLCALSRLLLFFRRVFAALREI